jgi:hypothetical protein
MMCEGRTAAMNIAAVASAATPMFRRLPVMIDILLRVET